MTTEGEDTSNAVNHNGAEILSSETQILTLGKSEGVSNAGEDDGASLLATDVQTKDNTEHEENGAAVYEPKTSTSPPQREQVRRQNCGPEYVHYKKRPTRMSVD